MLCNDASDETELHRPRTTPMSEVSSGGAMGVASKRRGRIREAIRPRYLRIDEAIREERFDIRGDRRIYASEPFARSVRPWRLGVVYADEGANALGEIFIEPRRGIWCHESASVRKCATNRSIVATPINAAAEGAVECVPELMSDRHRRRRTQIDRAFFDDEKTGRRYGPRVDVDAEATQ